MGDVFSRKYGIQVRTRVPSKVCHFYKELTLLGAGAINDVNAAGQAFIS